MRKADAILYKLSQLNTIDPTLNNDPKKVSDTAKFNNMGVAKRMSTMTQGLYNFLENPDSSLLGNETPKQTTTPQTPDVGEIPPMPQIPEMPKMPSTKMPKMPATNVKKTSYEKSFKTKDFDSTLAEVQANMNMSFEDRIKKMREKTGSFKFIDLVKESGHKGEGYMAKYDALECAKDSKDVFRMIDESMNLPEWLEAKITKASDYMNDVKDYLSNYPQFDE